MADFPDTKRLEADVARRIYPRPASPTSSPQLDRAVEALRKVYPKDMVGADVAEMPWSNPFSNTNVLGETDPENAVRINPSLSILYPQPAVEATLAHELQHVRQNKRVDNPALEMLKQQSIPYNERPSEIEAREARNAYVREHPDPRKQMWMIGYPYSPKQFPKSPLVE